jgi:hypothetical protein
MAGSRDALINFGVRNASLGGLRLDVVEKLLHQRLCHSCCLNALNSLLLRIKFTARVVSSLLGELMRDEYSEFRFVNSIGPFLIAPISSLSLLDQLLCLQQLLRYSSKASFMLDHKIISQPTPTQPKGAELL